MKNLLIAALLASTATVALAQPSSSPAAPTPPGQPATSTMSSAPMTDSKAFVETAAVAGMFEVETSRLAVSQASDKKLKQFAQKMITDHSKANKELEALVASGKVTNVTTVPNALDADHQKLLDELKSLSGKEFDARYHQLQLDAHQQAVDLFQTEAQSGQDKELKSWAGKTLPHLKGHLKRIEAIKIAV